MNNDLANFFSGSAFDPFTVEPQGDFPIIPPGKYPVLTGVAGVCATRKGTGHYIKLPMTILDGPCKSRKLFDNINIDNPSQECVEIGLRTLSALAQAIGLQAVTDTDQLSNQVVIAHVKVKDDQNSVRTYSSPGGVAPPTAPGPAPERAAPTAPPATAPAVSNSLVQPNPNSPNLPWSDKEKA